jgi:phosphoribosylformimino-5-aminoimidazole carboxamide ribonucleotide (ProFAR) isomerase
VPFTLLPAIDLTEGRLGAFRPEGPVGIAAFGGDPVAAASAFAQAGAAWLHVVDMDLAFTGELRSLDAVRAVAAAVPGVRLQVSGGIATEEAVDRILDAGAARVVLGSAVLADPDATRRLMARADGRAIVGVEVAEGRIRPRGSAGVDLDLMQTLGWLALTPGVSALLLTTVTRVGGLTGPDLEVVLRVMRRGFPVLGAGGVASIDDLQALRSAGAVGAVVGRAAIEGALDLEAALAWAAV